MSVSYTHLDVYKRQEQDIKRDAQQTQCPIVTVSINRCKIRIIVDTGSQLSVLNAAWVQHNKKYFKNTAILPVNNLNITTATNKKERVKQQAYVTRTYKNLELEHPTIIMHKLIYDGILGIDILNTINAKINVCLLYTSRCV